MKKKCVSYVKVSQLDLEFLIHFLMTEILSNLRLLSRSVIMLLTRSCMVVLLSSYSVELMNHRHIPPYIPSRLFCAPPGGWFGGLVPSRHDMDRPAGLRWGQGAAVPPKSRGGIGAWIQCTMGSPQCTVLGAGTPQPKCHTN